jgi:prepilin-type N-terminal cleavage/methylation domain-containing protein
MNKQKGFTLVELLVVIAIIGLLSTLAVVSLNSARAKSRDAKRIADIKQIQTALEMYYNDNNAYPATASVVSGSALSTFMAMVPTAPTPYDTATCQTTNAYSYTMLTGGTGYTLTFCLGANTGGLLAGARTASEAGIK